MSVKRERVRAGREGESKSRERESLPRSERQTFPQL